LAGNELLFPLALLALARMPQITIAVKPENGKVTNRPVLLPIASAAPKRKKDRPSGVAEQF
jgi:hypothetical protein